MNTNDPLVGKYLGAFLIQQPLGHGGMARVYKGIDTGLKRVVAIKVIEEGLRTSDSYTRRFEGEAQALANLKHPNIVTIFQFGKHENLYYLVMEYVDGADLDAILHNYGANGELMPHGDMIRVLDAVGSALDYAHRQRVIHRDVKPSNIMLERDGRPVLTDFGLALRVDTGTRGDTFGSPHYISPEQARSSANAVPQSDLYSLAVVAYEMLTGTLPFDDPSPTALAMQHIMAEVPSPRAFNRNLSEQVEQVLIKGLAKTPQERFESGADFVSALRQALDLLKQNPAKVGTVDLPPLPPGIEPQPPRRLSMQTALDKVNQERALTQARGQALTHYPEADALNAGRTQSGASGEAATAQHRAGWLPYLVAIGGAALILVVIGFALSRFAGGAEIPTVAAAPTTPTFSASATNATSPSPNNTVVAVIPPTQPSPMLTPSPLSPSKPPAPTNTATFATTIPPTKSPTAVPTAVPTTSVPASMVILTAATTAAPTVVFPNGWLLVLFWDDKTFYASNQSGQRIPIANLAFERLLTNNTSAQRYGGNRWAAYYPYSEPNKCVILKVEGTLPTIPRTDCPYGYNSEINAQDGELFWTTADNSVQFRVLWNKQEIARCDIATQRCEIRVPAA